MVTGNTMCPIRMNFKLGRGIQLSGTAVGWSAQEPGTAKLKLDWPVFEPRFHPFSNCVSLVFLRLNFLICKIWGQYQKSPHRANNVCKILRIWSRAFTRYEPIDRGKRTEAGEVSESAIITSVLIIHSVHSCSPAALWASWEVA